MPRGKSVKKEVDETLLKLQNLDDSLIQNEELKNAVLAAQKAMKKMEITRQIEELNERLSRL